MIKVARPTTMSDRTLNRLLVACGLALLIGVPAIAAFYYFDRHVDPGPSAMDRSIATAEAAVRANPKDLGARNSLGAAYLKADRFDDAINQFTEVLKAAASNRAALLGRGVAYLGAKRLDPAGADLQAVIADASKDEYASSDPQLEQAYYQLGLVDLQRAQPKAAADALQKALAIDGGDADALYSFGVALLRSGDPTKASLAFRRAVGYVPTGWCEPYSGLADAYKQLGQTDGVTYATAMVAFCEGQAAEADQRLATVTTGSLANDALIGRALVAAGRGDNPAAAAFYKQVLTNDPGNVLASIGLSSINVAESAAPPASTSPAASGNH